MNLAGPLRRPATRLLQGELPERRRTAVRSAGRAWFAVAMLSRVLALALVPAALVLVPPPVQAAPSAVTLYALNCMGCHQPPVDATQPVQPLHGQFADGATGRVFFIGMPQPPGRKLTAAEDAQMLEEIMTWKRSCSVILQQAPLVVFGQGKSVR